MIPHDLYEEIERELMPLIRRKAARLKGHMDLDDAIQEARVVLYRALQGYDFNRNPDLERFVGVCLNNAFAGHYNKAVAQRRMPRVAVRWPDGSYRSLPVPPTSMSKEGVLIEPPAKLGDPEEGCMVDEAAGLATSLMDQVMTRLNDREQAVLLCFAHPPRAIDADPSDAGFNIQVAEYLGLNKNMLDWSLHRIRQTMLDVARQPEFEDDIGITVAQRGWPYMVHSPKWDDRRLLDRVLSERRLNRTVQQDVFQKAPGACRWSLMYDWGEMMCLRLGSRAATIVMEGRFNRLSGTLFGDERGSQNIPLPWYQRCMKKINAQAAQD